MGLAMRIGGTGATLPEDSSEKARHVRALRVPNGAASLGGPDAARGIDVELWGLDAVMVGTPTRPDAPVELVRASADEPGTLRFDVPAPLLALGPGKTFTIVLERPRSDPSPAPVAQGFDSALPDGPTPPLTDVTHRAGLHFAHLEGPREQLDIRPTMGPGAAWGDLDRDGLLDLVVLKGGGRPEAPLPDRVWLGGEHGNFTDATAGPPPATRDGRVERRHAPRPLLRQLRPGPPLPRQG